ncbi:BTAD domain-containing putative transcriptional regulator [Fodinicola feengrottensis]|uniref:BTAD domain-containing putative transcriptional regulator n=1 Tax=Fodinicola feengrottensis TaxID=435914 RepID=A0ABN2G5S8_9ACTN
MDGRQVPVGAGKRRALLGCLALHGGQVLSVSRLVEALWEGEPPAGVRNQIQVYVSALRRVFAAAGLPDEVIRTDPAGYRLRLPAGSRDIDRFAVRVTEAEGRLADGQTAAAVRHLQDGLALWRGPALGGVDAPFAAAAAAQLEERRMAALCLRISADLALGRHADLVFELRSLVADHPLNEGLAARLMVALQGTGRVADALAVYRATRGALVAELGIEPGEQLRDLERTVLAGGTTDLYVHRWCGAKIPTKRPRQSAVPRPNQLPADLGVFVGRTEQVREAAEALRRDGPAPPTVVMVGPAGAGKSAFAVHLAHQVRDDYPDGVLYANLRGTEQPADPSAVLAGFLRALGVPPASIPDDTDERSRLARSALADRRVLVVLDDASGATQVQALLPGTGSCGVLITARAEIPAVAGKRIALGMLAQPDALAMLAGLVGADRLAAETAAAQEIVAQCGYLPLAVRIAGARLAARPHWTLQRLADALADEHSRLDVLATGDLAVRASVELSLRGLPERVREAFATLGLLPVGAFPSWVLAPLLDTSAAEAAELLDALVDVHLVEADSYHLHDLVRLFARERAAATISAQRRRMAALRLVWACLDLARTADTRMDLGFVDIPADPAVRWQLPPAARDRILADPAGWFGADFRLLADAVEMAVTWNQPVLAGALAGALANYCEINAFYDDWRRTHETALAALAIAGPASTEATTDLVVEMALLRNLGELHTIEDRYVKAVGYFESALAIAVRLENSDYQGAALSGLGYLFRILGRYDEAVRSFAAASDICLATGNRSGLVYAQQGIATIHREQGRLDQAERCLQASLAHCREPLYLHGLTQCLRGLGAIQLARREIAPAIETLTAASEAGAKLGAVDATHSRRWLAEARTRNGEPAVALSILDGCLRVYGEKGHTFGLGMTWHSIAGARLAAGDAAGAEVAARSAVRIWESLGTPYALAETLVVLAEICRQRAMPAVAERTARQAADIRESLGIEPLSSHRNNQTGPGQL